MEASSDATPQRPPRSDTEFFTPDQVAATTIVKEGVLKVSGARQGSKGGKRRWVQLAYPSLVLRWSSPPLSVVEGERKLIGELVPDEGEPLQVELGADGKSFLVAARADSQKTTFKAVENDAAVWVEALRESSAEGFRPSTPQEKADEAKRGGLLEEQVASNTTGVAAGHSSGLGSTPSGLAPPPTSSGGADSPPPPVHTPPPPKGGKGGKKASETTSLLSPVQAMRGNRPSSASDKCCFCF